MKSRAFIVPILAVIFTLATPLYFIVQTVLADQLGAAPMTAALAIGVFALSTLVTGLPKRDELRGLGRTDAFKAALAGILGVFVSQYLVLAHRYSDAPPGTEVIFFTTACWGMLVLVAAVAARRKPTAPQFVSAAIAVFAAAAVLANWERPSSFSPFVRYPAEDVWMLVAGAAWAAFSVLMFDLSSRHRLRTFLPLGTGAAAVVSIVVALLGSGRAELFELPPGTWLELAVAAITLSAMVITWSWLTSVVGVASSASLLFLPTVTLTVLGVWERRAGFAGPSPLLWQAVTWGSIATVVGAVGVALLVRLSRAPGEPDVTETGALPGWEPLRRSGTSAWLAFASVALSSLAVAGAVVTLWAPALSASVVGARTTGERYAASWTMSGAETPAAWIAFFACLLALIAGVGLAWRAWAPLKTVIAAACSALALAAVPALLDTPLRTWTRWIPADVQQDYGTEYARLTLARAYGASAMLTLVLGGAALVLLVMGALLALRRRRSQAEPSNDQQHPSDGQLAQTDGGM